MEELAAPLAAACASLADLPTVFFGHSMGASIAYETALRLEGGYGIDLAALCVSGRSAPGSGRRRAFLPGDDDALGRALVQLGGTDVAALLNSGLRELVLPVIRADYRLIARYDARASARPVSAPLIAYYGVADEDLDERSVGAWAAFTRACFTLRAMPGGHFYLRDDTAGLVHDVLAQVGPAELRDPAVAG
jgi:pyochelin biosynthetic protein PchC